MAADAPPASAAQADAGRISALTPQTVNAELDFAADTTEVAQARHYVRQLAAKVLGYGERTEDVRLAISEIFTNAIVHGDGSTINVRVFTTAKALRVEVRDSGRDDAPHIPDSPTDDYGRGLAIVEAFTDRWGCMREAGTLCVWFEVQF